MIRAILFDFDGVLTVDKYGSVSVAKFLSAKTGIPCEAVRSAYGKYNGQMLLGQLTHREMWPDFCRDIGMELPFGLLDEAFRTTPMDPEMLRLVRELRKTHKTGMVTDNPAERMRIALEHPDLRGLFDAVSVSGEVGSRKDQPMIFEQTLSVLGLAPEECVFIDNTPKNLIIPGQMGMKTILFDDEARDVASLRRTLNEMLN